MPLSAIFGIRGRRRAAILLLCLVLPLIPLRSASATGIVWMISTKALSLIAAQPDGAGLIEQFFDNPNTYVMAPPDQLALVPAKAIATVNFSSFAAMRSQFGARTVDPRYRAVLYDCEAWDYTPLNEQKNPIYYNTLAAQLAHNFHLKFISAPATTLRKVLLRPLGPGRYPPFMATGIVGPIAAVADIFEIQAQGLLPQPEKYRSLVTNALTAATAANAKIIFIAGLSTGPSGRTVTARQLYNAVVVTRQTGVAGYWLNIPQQSGYCEKCSSARPDVATGMLELLQSNFVK